MATAATGAATRSVGVAAPDAQASAQLARSKRELPLNLAASILTGVTAVAIFNPLDCLRVRWQVLSKAQSGGHTIVSFAKEIVAREGLIRGLWAPGLGANVMAIGMSTGLRLGLYPVVRDHLVVSAGHADRSPRVMFAAGLGVGAVSYWLATPLWCAKTRLQGEAGIVNAEGVLSTGARAGKHRLYHYTPQVLTYIVQNEGGFTKLWRGAVSLVTRGALLTSGQMGGYDATKTIAKRTGIIKDGPLLHVTGSIVAAFCAVTVSAPFDMIMTRCTLAPFHPVVCVQRAQLPLCRFAARCMYPAVPPHLD